MANVSRNLKNLGTFAKYFLMEGAAIMVKEPGGLAAAIKDLLENTEKAEHMGQKAKGIIDKNTGAVKKAVALVRSFLGNSYCNL